MLLLFTGLVLAISLVSLQKTSSNGALYLDTKKRWQSAEQSQALYWAAQVLAPAVIDHAELQERLLKITTATPSEATTAIEALCNRAGNRAR